MRFGLLSLLLCTSFVCAQAPPQPTGPALADYTAKREIALAPALQFVQKGDYIAALTTLEPVLSAYPHDLRVLFLTADAERITGNFDKALDLYRQCLELKVVSPGVIHLGLVRTDADMNRWEDFNRERAVVRQLALNGDATLSVDRGYLIEDHRGSGQHVQVLEFPSQDPAAITRYRFLFLGSKKAGPPFIPSIDLESNPADAASFAREFPAKAAAHLRPFALASYPDPHSRAFLKFYSNGEPAYQDVRSDVFKSASTLKNSSPKAPQTNPKRPAYQPQKHLP